jgi:hypothetical protein
MLFRPMACFALIAAGIDEASRRRWKSLATLALSAVLVLTAGTLCQAHFRRGDALANFRYQVHSPNAYGGQLLDRPFKALVVYPLAARLPFARIGYLWAHALVILVACGVAARRTFGNPSSTPPPWLVRISATWLLANTAFILCLGAPWGFQCFHRFSIPAAPAMWWFLRRALPTGRWGWLWFPIAAASAAAALVTILSEAPSW